MTSKNQVQHPRAPRKSWFRRVFCCEEDGPTSPDKIQGTSLVQPSAEMDIKNPSSKKVEPDPKEQSFSVDKSSSSDFLSSRNFSGKPPPNFSYDRVFILGQKNKIVCKVTLTKVAIGSSFIEVIDNKGKKNNASPAKSHKSDNKEIFSLYEQGIKSENISGVTPEEVAKHIAKRLRCDTVIDALCGFGGNTIQVIFTHKLNSLVGKIL
jgi:hypothetical protein